MKTLRLALSLISVLMLTATLSHAQTNATTAATTNAPTARTLPQTEADWQKLLSPEQYRILREKGTERAFTGQYWNTKDQGTYRCAGCGEILFTSETKFDSGCGWPSFYAANTTNNIVESEDRTHGMVRTEVTCKKCGGHLGHLFDDGPKPTGLRYCINSGSLKFEAQQEPPKPDKK